MTGVVFDDAGRCVWDLEHGDHLSLLVDADLGDEGLDGAFALAGGAGGEDLAEVGPELFDGVRWWWGWFGPQEVGEFLVAGVELGAPVAEVFDPGAGGGVVHGAVFEGGVVALDGGVGAGDLGGDGVAFGVPFGVGVVEPLLGGGDDADEDLVEVGVEVDEGGKDGGVGGVGVEADAGAAGAAVAVAGEAGVVAVGAGAAGGGGAEVLASAVGAGDQAGEVVVAG